jgi:hypothetical protein
MKSTDTSFFRHVHPYKKGGIRRLTYNKEGEESYKEKEMMQKDDRGGADSNPEVPRNALAELQSPTNSSEDDDSSSDTNPDLVQKKGKPTRKRKASPLVPGGRNAPGDFSDGESVSDISVTSVETAALVERSKQKDKDEKHKVRRGRRDGRLPTLCRLKGLSLCLETNIRLVTWQVMGVSGLPPKLNNGCLTRM